MAQSELTEGEREALSKFRDVLDKMRMLWPTITVQQAYLFCTVALDEHQTVNHYCAKTDISQSVVSRTLLDLGSTLRNNEPGLGLLDRRYSPISARETQTFITAKGRALVRSLADTINRKR